MARTNVPGDGGHYVWTVPLKAEDHAVGVEVTEGLIQLSMFGLVAADRWTLSRAEARSVGLHLIAATNQVAEEGGR
jgi:hypothetical protein